MLFVQLFINWWSFLLLQDRDNLPLNSIHRLLPVIVLWKNWGPLHFKLNYWNNIKQVLQLLLDMKLINEQMNIYIYAYLYYSSFSVLVWVKWHRYFKSSIVE